MTIETQEILLGLLKKKSKADISFDFLNGLAKQYPYFDFIHYALAAVKLQENGNDTTSVTNELSLHTSNLNWLLLRLNDENLKKDIPATDFQIPIEPYHTVDYFASQGIKLGKLEESDLLGKRVKSFTSWLKTMKKIQPSREQEESPEQLTQEAPEGPGSSAIATTEAMAEVYLKQGQKEKAIEILHKLSLQNPANSHIFARKITDIKENRL